LDAAHVAGIPTTVTAIRGRPDGFDIAVAAGPDRDHDDLRASGASWVLPEFRPGDGPEQVLRVIDRGKPS
jgi:hypothetical protein